MDLIPAISSANSALTLLGKVTDLVKKGATIELQEAIVNLRQSVLTLKEENLCLREENSSLQQSIKKRESFVFEAPVYFQLMDNGTKDGPFCQVCHDNQNKTIRLTTREEGSWQCKVCGGYFETHQHKVASDARLRAHNAKTNNGFNVFDV